MTRLVVRPVESLEPQLADAVAVIRRGGVVAFPTDTLYGLAADPRSTVAVDRVVALKGRASSQTIALVAADRAQVERISALTMMARHAAAEFWPGPLTVLVRSKPGLAPSTIGPDGLVGVRVPDHDVALALARACGHALTATSANRSGQPATADPDEVAAALPDLDLLLDAGRAPGGPPSTLVDLSGDVPRLVRAGAIPWERVLEFCTSFR
jgi:L-threonylcarbamoyladenylate synthase